MGKLITVRMHRGAKPGDVLRYSDGATQIVTPQGNRVNVIAGPDGKPIRKPKLNKKQRRRMRDEAPVQSR